MPKPAVLVAVAVACLLAACGSDTTGPVPVPPTIKVGSTKTFKVCATDQCTGFVDVTATARHVGAKVAIYVDNAVTFPDPAGNGYTQADLDGIGRLFDTKLYPIDTTNFGRETDIDANGVVQVLLTPQINKLSGNCNQTKSIILGYFLSTDLVPSAAGSNKGEVFYSIVPQPNNLNCTVSKSFAVDNLGPTFVHEFQHMINFGQKVVILKGAESEDTWLNEGLSHYAEELGGRLIPDTAGQQPGTTYAQFAVSDFQNAYEYLDDPESNFLIEPFESSGTLAERGANFLMVRWLSDQFGTTTPNPSSFLVRGTDFTKKLVQTTAVGWQNVQTQSAQPFPTTVSQWQMANYLDDLPNFTPADQRIQYTGINLRSIFQQLNQQAPQFFAKPYPLTPDSTPGGYSRTGTLRAGSGRHVRIMQLPMGAAVEFELAASGTTFDCAPVAATVLAAGAYAILDPTTTAMCVAVPAADASGAEHLYVALATAGDEVQGGISAPYSLTGTSGGVTLAIAAQPSTRVASFRQPGLAERFHMMLRAREKAVSRDLSRRSFAPRVAPAPSFATAVSSTIVPRVALVRVR